MLKSSENKKLVLPMGHNTQEVKGKNCIISKPETHLMPPMRTFVIKGRKICTILNFSKVYTPIYLIHKGHMPIMPLHRGNASVESIIIILPEIYLFYLLDKYHDSNFLETNIYIMNLSIIETKKGSKLYLLYTFNYFLNIYMDESKHI